jgi:hypothetical protein
MVVSTHLSVLVVDGLEDFVVELQQLELSLHHVLEMAAYQIEFTSHLLVDRSRVLDAPVQSLRHLELVHGLAQSDELPLVLLPRHRALP